MENAELKKGSARRGEDGRGCRSHVKLSAGGGVLKSKPLLEPGETWILVAGLPLTHCVTLGKPRASISPTVLEGGCTGGGEGVPVLELYDPKTHHRKSPKQGSHRGRVTCPRRRGPFGKRGRSPGSSSGWPFPARYLSFPTCQTARGGQGRQCRQTVLASSREGCPNLITAEDGKPGRLGPAPQVGQCLTPSIRCAPEEDDVGPAWDSDSPAAPAGQREDSPLELRLRLPLRCSPPVLASARSPCHPP